MGIIAALVVHIQMLEIVSETEISFLGEILDSLGRVGNPENVALGPSQWGEWVIMA